MVFTFINTAQAAVFYIDPSQAVNGTGTFSSSFKSLPAISDNNTYLFKAGTTYTIGGTIMVSVDNVTFGSYGAGEKPVIYNAYNSRRTIEFRSRNCRATIFYFISMLNRTYMRWTVISFLIAWSLAYFAVRKWLDSFAYRTGLSWWIFAPAGVMALGIALLTVSWQSWRSAKRNPVEALRYE